MLNRYIPQVDEDGNVLWNEPYIKNKEVKRMTIPYEKRKEYYRRYRETHKEKMKEYARNYWKRKKMIIIRKMIKERI